jgi:hypothetical protein
MPPKGKKGPAAGAGAAAAGAAAAAVAGIDNTGIIKLLLHNLLNRLDIQKDATEPTTAVAPTQRDLFNELINTLINQSALVYPARVSLPADIMAKLDSVIDRDHSYDSKKLEFKRELKKLLNYTVEIVPITRYKKKALNLPVLYDFNNLLGDHSIRFAIQDSGKSYKAFDATLNSLVTPGAYLDPASRENPDDDSSICMEIQLDKNDFNEVGLGHIIDSLVISKTRINKQYMVSVRVVKKAYLTENLNFIIGPDINDIIETADYRFLQGNNEKNTRINSIIATAKEDATKRHEIYAYCIMKLLGDMLQAYYPSKILKNKIKTCTHPFSRDDICLFTSDKFLADRCALLEIPCIVEGNEEKASGSDRSEYLYYKYNTSPVQIRAMNSHILIEMIRNCISKINLANKALKDGLIMIERVPYKIDDNHPLLYIRLYIVILLELIINLFNHIIPSTTPLIKTEILKYDMPAITIDSKTALFKAELSKYMPTNILTDKMQVIELRKVFPGLDTNHQLNWHFLNITREGGRILQLRDFFRKHSTIQPIRYSGGRSPGGTILRIKSPHTRPHLRGLPNMKYRFSNKTSAVNNRRHVTMKLPNIRNTLRIRRSNNAEQFKELSKSEVMIQNINALDITSTIRNIIAVALQYIGKSAEDYIVDDYIEILEPYYEFIGRTSVNPVFYTEIIPKLDKGNLSFDEFKHIYNRVHHITVESVYEDYADNSDGLVEHGRLEGGAPDGNIDDDFHPGEYDTGFYSIYESSGTDAVFDTSLETITRSFSVAYFAYPRSTLIPMTRKHNTLSGHTKKVDVKSTRRFEASVKKRKELAKLEAVTAKRLESLSRKRGDAGAVDGLRVGTAIQIAKEFVKTSVASIIEETASSGNANNEGAGSTGEMPGELGEIPPEFLALLGRHALTEADREEQARLRAKYGRGAGAAAPINEE